MQPDDSIYVVQSGNISVFVTEKVCEYQPTTCFTVTIIYVVLVND